MENINTTQTKTSTLRQRAEALLKDHHEKANLTSAEVDMLKLIHELNVHQIELELQNEKLKPGKSDVEAVVDITERKLAEDALHEIKFKYDELVRRISVGLYKLHVFPDGEMKFEYVSDKFCKMLGLEEQVALNNPESVFSAIHPDDYPAMVEANRIAAKTLELFHWEGRCRIWGKMGWIRIESEPTILPDGGSLWNGVIFDITRRKNDELTLQQNEARFRSYFELPLIGIAITSPEKGWIEANDGLKAMLGYSMEELSGLTWDELTHPDDLAYDVEQFNRVMSDQQDTYFLEKRFIHKNGNIIWTNLSVGCVRNPDRSVNYTVALFQNITDRKLAEEALRESEEKFRTIAETSPLAIYISSGIEQKTEYINQTFVKMFGYTMEDVPTVEEWYPLAYPDEIYRQKLLDEWQRKVSSAIKTQSEIEPMEVVVTCKDGSLKNIQWGYKTIGKQNWAFGLDLTERIQAEIENQKTQKLLEDSQRIGKIGGWEYYFDNMELKWTKEMYNIHEVDLTFNLSVDKRVDFYTAESLSAVNTAMQRAIEFGESYEVDSEIITAKGNRRSVKAIGKADLVNRRVFGFFQDITDRKKTEVELLKANSYLENLINFANAPIIVWDPQFRITRFNHAFEFITGLTEAEVLGKSLEILFPPALAENSMNLIIKTQTGEHWETVEIKIQHLDKSVRTLLWNSATLFMTDGKTPIATIAQGHDITERKQMEEKLIESSTRLVLAARAGHVGIWDYDVVNNVLEWDDQMFSLYGITKSQFGGAYEAWLAGVHPDYKAQGEAEIQLALNGEKEFDTEFKVLWPDGSVHDIRAMAIVVRSNTGKPLRMIGTNWDITRQKKSEAEIKQRNEELRELNATKDKFFSIIAHDLKSPFNSILGFSELLVEQISEKDYDGIEQYAGIIRQSSQKAFDLLMNLIEWSRSQTGRLEFNPVPFNLIESILEITALFDDIAGQKGIAIKRELPPEATVFADLAMLNTVLRNLISNAIKFTKPGGEIIMMVTEEKNKLTVAVKDNGIGISKDRVEKLFRIEESESSPGTANEKGTGLGLILCKEFVEKNGGKIWVESEKGKGSMFSFTIPHHI